MGCLCVSKRRYLAEEIGVFEGAMFYTRYV